MRRTPLLAITMIVLNPATTDILARNSTVAAVGINCFICHSNITLNDGDTPPSPQTNPCADSFNTTGVTSVNGFHVNDLSMAHYPVSYHTPCYGGHHSQQDGILLLADHCVKIDGTRRYRSGLLDSNGAEIMKAEQIYIRTCVSSARGSDPEILRSSYCGIFNLGPFQYNGCVHYCNSDGCNSSRRLRENISLVMISLVVALLIMCRQLGILF